MRIGGNPTLGNHLLDGQRNHQRIKASWLENRSPSDGECTHMVIDQGGLIEWTDHASESTLMF